MPRAFVLAGGHSTRMGRDKAQLLLGGRSLLERSLDLLREAGFTPTIAGLRTPVNCSAPCVFDTTPDAGPLGGIEAALASLSGEPTQPALFLPVDLPLLPAAFVASLFDRAGHSGALATVPDAGGRPQPLCAVYHSSLADGIRDALRRGDRKVMRVVGELAPGSSFDRFRVEALAPLHGWRSAHRWFWNINTSQDFEAVESLHHP